MDEGGAASGTNDRQAMTRIADPGRLLSFHFRATDQPSTLVLYPVSFLAPSLDFVDPSQAVAGKCPSL